MMSSTAGSKIREDGSSSSKRRGIVVLAATLVFLLAGATAVYAYWQLSGSATMQLSAGQLAAPTVTCTQNSSNSIRINWSGNPSTGVTGYTVVRNPSRGTASTTNYGPGITSLSDAGGGGGGIILGASYTITYTVTARYGSWESPEGSHQASAYSGTLFRSATITC